MLTTFYPPYNFGGDGIWVQRLSEALVRLGHHVDVVHSVDAYNLLRLNRTKQPEPIPSDVNVYSLKSSLGGLTPLLIQQTGRSLLQRQMLQEMIAEKNYDVIGYHNMSLIGLEAFSWGNAVKLYTAHEYWLICPMHILWRYNREACEKRTCISCQIQGSRPLQLWRYSDYMQRQLAHIDMILSPSQFLIDKYREGGIKAEYGLMPLFTPTPDSISATNDALERPYFLYVGRLEKLKGLQEIIPVFKKYPRADLLIAGEGNYQAELKQIAAGAENIRFLGRLDYQALQQLYKNTQALILPTLCYEIFGLVILEAFSQGAPAIVNNIGGMPELISKSNGGFVYNTPEEIPALLDRLLDEPGLRQQLGENSYQAFLTNWTESVYIEKYFALIRDIARRKKIESPAIAATAHS